MRTGHRVTLTLCFILFGAILGGLSIGFWMRERHQRELAAWQVEREDLVVLSERRDTVWVRPSGKVVGSTTIRDCPW